MAKKNNLRKMIAIALASAMSVAHTGMLNVFADGEVPLSENPAAVESGSGTLEDPFIIEVELIESTTDYFMGETTTVSESESQWFGSEEDENGYTTIKGREESDSTAVTDAEGNVLEGSGSTEGTEVKTEVSQEVSDEKTTQLEPEQQGEAVITEGEEAAPEAVGELTPVGEPEQVGEEESESGSISVENAGEVSVELKPGETKTESAGAQEEMLDAYKEELEKDLPEGAEVKEIYDENNQFIGYEIASKGEISEESAPVAEGDPVIGEWSEGEFVPTGNVETIPDTEGTVTGTTEEIILPEKPEESESYDEESGRKTVVSVSEIYDPNDSSKVIGYSKTTTVTDADGNQLSSSNENLYGTVVSRETTEYNDEVKTEEAMTQNREVTQSYVSNAEQTIIDEEIKVNELNDRTLEASMSEVEAGAGHGNTDTTSIKPAGVADVYTGNDLPTAEELKDFAFKFVDNALSSSIRVNTSEGNIKAHQFMLVDAEGKIHVALCADFDTNARDGYRYDMVNVTEASYYDDEAAEMIVAIAHNGFWGTADAAEGEAENLGSLAAVKEFLRENSDLSDEQINKLTKDEALTATQAALWKFGNHEESSLYENNVAGGNYISNASKARVQALYNALVNIDPEEVEKINNNNPVLATEDTFATSSTITVGEKSTDEKYAEANSDEDPDNDVYDTSIEFTMAFEPTENDDLIVKILDSKGNVLEERRLAGAAKEEEGFIKRIFKGDSNDAVYVIENVQLAEGVNVTLNLSGTQNLGQGVYLYSSEIKGNLSSQTFVGIAEGTREVNLNVNMNFNVNEASVEYEKTSTESVQKYEREYESTREDVKVTTQVSSEIVTREETETQKVTKREWSDEWKMDRVPADPTSGDIPIPEEPPVTPPPVDPPVEPPVIPEEPPVVPVEPPIEPVPEYEEEEEDEEEEVIIIDEEVPLTDIPDEEVPLTGVSSLWSLLSIASLGGLVIMKAEEKRHRK